MTMVSPSKEFELSGSVPDQYDTWTNMSPRVILGQSNITLLKNQSGQGHIGLEGVTNSRFSKYLLAAGKY